MQKIIKPLTRAEYYALLMTRAGKETTKARPAREYFDPARTVRFKGEGKNEPGKQEITNRR